VAATADIVEEVLRPLGRWAAACAERALPIFEQVAADDRRPREAIDAVREFADAGRPRTNGLRAAGWAAHHAASEVDHPSAASAARAASLAAASAFLHTDIVSRHQIRHVLGPAVYAAQAHELASDGDPERGDEEIRWAAEHASPPVRALLRRMSPPPPVRTRLGALYLDLDRALR
jgi:hypothetical protein